VPVRTAPTVWFTGLSGSGKSTLARAVADLLRTAGVASHVVDGDELRATLSADLGFSLADRAEQVRRAGHLARILGDAGVIALVTLVSPVAADRDRVRAMHPDGRFLEVHVATPLEVCEARDVKGLYARARAGEITDLTGVGQPYEPPIAPELVVDASGLEQLEAQAAQVVAAVAAVLGTDIAPQPPVSS
jgi:adenylyl-sulfate kinase